jgi:hypothetical protein
MSEEATSRAVSETGSVREIPKMRMPLSRQSLRALSCRWLKVSDVLEVLSAGCDPTKSVGRLRREYMRVLRRRSALYAGTVAAKLILTLRTRWAGSPGVELRERGRLVLAHHSRMAGNVRGTFSGFTTSQGHAVNDIRPRAALGEQALNGLCWWRRWQRAPNHPLPALARKSRGESLERETAQTECCIFPLEQCVLRALRQKPEHVGHAER